MQELLQQIWDLVLRTWRYRWIALVLAWPVALAGWWYVYQMPDVYRASTRVYVDTQSLLRPLMSGLTVMPRIDQQLAMVSETLLARPNLEEVARRSDLDLGVRSENDMEALVNQLGRDINLRGSPRDNLYSISYVHADPQKARQVVQSLLNTFVESSLGNARSDLGSSQTFINDQIKAYEERLAAMEDRIKQFKRENQSFMPGQGGGYYSQLDDAKRQLEQARLQLNEAVQRRDTFRARLGGENVELPPGLQGGEGRTATAELNARIAELESRLDQLRLRYTDQHPDVKATQVILEDLRRQRDEIAQTQVGGGGDAPNTYHQQLQFALAQADSEVASLRARVTEYQQRYRELQEAVDRVPAVEAGYKQLTRDYGVLQEKHQSLLERRETAMLSGQIQSGTQSVNFRIIDPPHVPSEPAGPNRLVYSSAAFVVALGSGGGIAFLLGQVRRTVTTRHALERLTQRPFLGAVSVSATPAYRRRRVLGAAAFTAGLAALMAAYGGVLFVFMST